MAKILPLGNKNNFKTSIQGLRWLKLKNHKLIRVPSQALLVQLTLKLTNPVLQAKWLIGMNNLDNKWRDLKTKF